MQEKNQLESQISKLRNKCQDLELKGILLMIEIERLENVMEEKSRERESLKDKMIDMEANNNNQLEDFKRQFENMFKSRIVNIAYVRT